jgi:hypothetical protein
MSPARDVGLDLGHPRPVEVERLVVERHGLGLTHLGEPHDHPLGPIGTHLVENVTQHRRVRQPDRTPPPKHRVGPGGGITHGHDTGGDRLTAVDERQVPVLGAQHHLHRGDRFRHRAYRREIGEQRQHPLPYLLVTQRTPATAVPDPSE